MIVIIDGYNLLRQVFPKAKGYLDRQRSELVRQLGHYKHKKNDSIKELIIVFDAGPLGHATREVHHGVVEMYSGQRSTADDWIIEYVHKHKEKELLLVTNDRKLIERCQHGGLDAMDVYAFYDLVQHVLAEDVTFHADNVTDIEKYEDSDSFDLEGFEDQKKLDLLMFQETMNMIKQHERDDGRNKKTKGNPHKLSKKKKQLHRKVKKLS